MNPVPETAAIRARDRRYAIRGYISIAAKHGASVITAIRDALAGNAWMPPIHDPP
jgi:transposase